MPEFELITFDCYGTLIDWELGMRNALKGIAEQKNLSIDLEPLAERYIEIELEEEQKTYRKYRKILTIGVARLFKEQGAGLTPDEAGSFANSVSIWQPFPETTEILSELKQREYKLAILSNIDEDLIKHSINLINVDFDGVITAEQTKSYKPAHNHWKRMLEVFKIPKNKVFHVAASYVHDIIPAKELGFTVAWINRKNQRIGDTNPDYEFNNLRPLTEIL